MASPIYLATRGSALALNQANLILAQCRSLFPDLEFELKIIKTTGDKVQTASLASGVLAKGLFTKELEIALLDREADLAVHSLKDLPTELPVGLKLGAVTKRADVRDVLIYRDVEHLIANSEPLPLPQKIKRGFRPHVTIEALPHGAVIGTSSTRRGAQLRERRPDLRIVPFRGNVGTRLKKLSEQGELDAIVLAAAGLERLQFRPSASGLLQGDEIPAGLAATFLSLSEMLPCVGQGAIALEIRNGDERMNALCEKVNHAETFACVTAERAFLHRMGGGCHAAVAAYGESQGGEIWLRALSFMGSGEPRRTEGRRPLSAAAGLGEELAAQLAD